MDGLLRERLLVLAREGLTNLPSALDAFETELAKPDGGAIGARVRLLDLSGWRWASVMGDADTFDHKLQPLIDAWRTVFDALRALEPPLQPVREDSGARAPAAMPGVVPYPPEFERAAPTPATTTEIPAAAESEISSDEWPLRKPLRDDGLAGAIYRVLKKAKEGNARRPTAREMLEAFRESRPPEIVRVLADGCDYFDRNGNEASADLESIRKRIATVTAAQAPARAGKRRARRAVKTSEDA